MRHAPGNALQRSSLFFMALMLLITACASPDPVTQPPEASTIGTHTAVPPTTTSSSTPNPTSTPNPPTATSHPPATVWVAPYLPSDFQDSLKLEADTLQSESLEGAAYLIDAGRDNPISQWVYALVAPFPTITDGVTASELQQAWQGAGDGPFTGIPLLMDENTQAVFTKLWGAAGWGAVKVLPADRLETYAWGSRPSWGIVPFEELYPRWKVLTIDDLSPVRVDFDPDAYALSVPISLVSNPDSQDTESLTGDGSPLQSVLTSNWQADKLTTVILTGVTAIVRATAETMRTRGITYPAIDIVDTLRGADITHVSNEVPFTPDCPFPNPKQPDLVFCSNPDYIELLTFIGTDVVELSGDHFSDWGPDAMRYTLDLYNEVGIPYYGGGYTEADARKPLLIEHNGNKLAFIGCNAKGGGYATARGENPGAVACDFEWMVEEMADLKAEGYLPIVTFQHFEYFTYVPQPKLIQDFHTAAEGGAVIVSGSQAHQPHGMEFYEDGFLHYGLGNLFFDQFHMGLPTGQGFLDRHVFYDGRHISTELIGIRFVNYARSRLMTPEEREELLRSVFDASGWLSEDG
ncbi:MAG: CapA family protein [Chloroflexota bacterium]|nr:CapA family protein [Chloroflexota bacterium]